MIALSLAVLASAGCPESSGPTGPTPTCEPGAVCGGSNVIINMGQYQYQNQGQNQNQEQPLNLRFSWRSHLWVEDTTGEQVSPPEAPADTGSIACGFPNDDYMTCNRSPESEDYWTVRVGGETCSVPVGGGGSCDFDGDKVLGAAATDSHLLVEIPGFRRSEVVVSTTDYETWENGS